MYAALRFVIEENAENPDFVILDVRRPEEFNTEHIEDAINVDFYSESFREHLDSLDKEKTYLIYCRTANRTGQTVPIMQELGFTQVYHMLGGITDWKAQGFETMALLQKDPYVRIEAKLAMSYNQVVE